MSDHFYLTLSSGVTKLPERMRLDGDYEVAISDFAYLTIGSTLTTETTDIGSAPITS
jgi:hypothetical protein